MTKTNAVALNDMELNMVAGGGLISDLKKMQDTFTIKESDSTLSSAVKTVGGLALLGVVATGIFKMVFRGY